MRPNKLSVCASSELLEGRTLFASAVGGWTPLARPAAARGLVTDLSLKAYKSLSLATGTIANTLSKAPLENLKYGVGRGENSRLVSLPTPDGTFARFRIVESAILTGQDAATFSNIKTYAGVGVDDATATVRLDHTPLGFHAQVLSPMTGAYYVEPLYKNSTVSYVSYYGRDSRARPVTNFESDAVEDLEAARAANSVIGQTAGRGVTSAGRTSAGTSGTAVSLRTYRTAVAATAEYTGYFGGTVAAGQAAIVTAINRVTGIYETELGIRLQLVPNNSSLVFTNSATDGYDNGDPELLLDQNQTKIDSVIGNANYDLGHVFSTAGGGLALLAAVGAAGYKAQGETGTTAPVGDAFYVDYVAHEMGHQFAGNHTFNTSADANRNASTAYEPGSGSTIMAYAGIEGSEDLQSNSDPYFSFASLDEILRYVDTGAYDVDGMIYTDTSVLSAGTRTATGNNIPTVAFGTTAYTIPANTPFILTAPTATDINGDTVYYSWEQANLGAARLLNQADNGSSPLFRVYNPTTNPSRSFPRLQSVLAGQTFTQTAVFGRYAERLPTTSRAMKFVLTLRDRVVNAGGVGAGGTNVYSGTPITVTSVAAASSFAISSLNASATYAGGSTQTLTWNVAGTTANGINTANVQIAYSTDGGTNFTPLVASTANDGAEAITLPNVATTQLRLRVSAVGNIFYDINNANLTLTATTGGTSATPGVPDLVAATDSGISTADDLTNRNNTAAARNLQFTVTGTVAGAAVNILADGAVIGTATATGTTTTVSTNGTTALLDGTRVFTATQTESGKSVSAASAGLNVVIDTAAPAVTGTPAFTYLTAGPTVTFATTEPAYVVLPQAYSATNTTTATNVPTANIVKAASGASVVLSFNGVAGAPSATTLTNGNYTAGVSAGAFADAAGNVNTVAANATFFWLNGDADRNRVVDFNDFVTLQSNFGQVNRNYAQGDFDYDGDVDFNDFVILQSNNGATV